jgi:hypothetical protein
MNTIPELKTRALAEISKAFTQIEECIESLHKEATKLEVAIIE